MRSWSSFAGVVDRWHAWSRTQPWLYRFTLVNRLLLATAFLPSGLVKATGQRFTHLPVSDSVGFFFEAMYRTGPYWIFIGVVQLTAAVLILIPRTALLGALLFLPVVASICLITWGVGFSGTVWITSAMLLSVLYLLYWDSWRVWEAVTRIVRPDAFRSRVCDDITRIEAIGWITGMATGAGLLLIARGWLPRALTPRLLVIGLVACALVGTGWLLTWRRHRT